jgi:hypothetical protein
MPSTPEHNIIKLSPDQVVDEVFGPPKSEEQRKTDEFDYFSGGDFFLFGRFGQRGASGTSANSLTTKSADFGFLISRRI